MRKAAGRKAPAKKAAVVKKAAPKTLTAEEVTSAVRAVQGGCQSGKNDFLKSLGLPPMPCMRQGRFSLSINVFGLSKEASQREVYRIAREVENIEGVEGFLQVPARDLYLWDV